MILDSSDPTGVGLFSRCARNHASKIKPNYRPSAGGPHSKTKPSEMFKKKGKVNSSFERQLSRDQREKAFRRMDTPPVGQYHPHCQKQSKLVWDILKVYNKQRKQQHKHLEVVTLEPDKGDPATEEDDSKEQV